MMELLPTDIFDWVNPKDFNLDTFSNTSAIGCSLEVDLDYRDELHDINNDYTLAGEKVEVKEEVLSNYQLQIIEHNNFPLLK